MKKFFTGMLLVVVTLMCFGFVACKKTDDFTQYGSEYLWFNTENEHNVAHRNADGDFVTFGTMYSYSGAYTYFFESTQDVTVIPCKKSTDYSVLSGSLDLSENGSTYDLKAGGNMYYSAFESKVGLLGKTEYLKFVFWNGGRVAGYAVYKMSVGIYDSTTMKLVYKCNLVESIKFNPDVDFTEHRVEEYLAQW